MSPTTPFEDMPGTTNDPWSFPDHGSYCSLMAITQRRRREKAARREAILDAGEALVVEQGYAATTMEQVAAAAELSKGTLYLYFENKDALCAGIAERILARFLPEVRAAVTLESTGLDKVRRILEAYDRFFAEHPHQFRFAVSWMFPGGKVDASSEAFEAYRQRVGSMVRLAVESIELGQRDGSIRPDVEPLLQTMQLWSSFLGVYLAKSDEGNLAQRIPEPIDFGRLVEVHIETMLRAIANTRAGDDA